MRHVAAPARLTGADAESIRKGSLHCEPLPSRCSGGVFHFRPIAILRLDTIDAGFGRNGRPGSRGFAASCAMRTKPEARGLPEGTAQGLKLCGPPMAERTHGSATCITIFPGGEELRLSNDGFGRPKLACSPGVQHAGGEERGYFARAQPEPKSVPWSLTREGKRDAGDGLPRKGGLADSAKGNTVFACSPALLDCRW
jgi:hypothetical protein